MHWTYSKLGKGTSKLPKKTLKNKIHSSDKIFSPFLDYTGVIEMLVSSLSEAALAHLDEEAHSGRKVSHLVLQALLDLLHNILKQTSVVVRSALQVCILQTLPT